MPNLTATLLFYKRLSWSHYQVCTLWPLIDPHRVLLKGPELGWGGPQVNSLTKACLGQQQVSRDKLYGTQAMHIHAEAKGVQSCGNSSCMFSFKEVFLGYGVAEFNQMLLWKKKLDHLRPCKAKRRWWA